MMRERTPFEVLQDLAPEADHHELVLARARLERLVEQERTMRPHPTARTRPVARPRLRLAVTAVALLTAGLGVGSLLPVGTSGTEAARFLGAMPAAAAATGVCGTHPDDSLRILAPQEWASYPDARPYMLGLPARTADSESLGIWQPSCTAAPAAVFYDGAGGRGITIYRDVVEPFTGRDGLDDVTVSGYSGRLLTPPSGFHYLTWVDGGGVRWLIEAGGITSADLVATVGSLDLGAPTGIAPPPGYSSATVPEAGPHRPGYRWAAQYGPAAVATPGPDGNVLESDTQGYAYLEVRYPAIAPVEAELARRPGAQLVTFDGIAAIYLPQEQGGAGLRWVRDGASHRLVIAGADLDRLVRTASELATPSPSGAQ